MAHRQSRVGPTRPRRVHLTDVEWQALKEKAEKAGFSISGYVAHLAVNPRTNSARADLEAANRRLTAIHELLSELTNIASSKSDSLSAGLMASALLRLSEHVEQAAQALRRSRVSEGRKVCF